MDESFGVEGDEDPLTLSLGGGRLDGGSFPFEHDGNEGGIILRLFRHEGDGVMGENEMRKRHLGH